MSYLACCCECSVRSGTHSNRLMMQVTPSSGTISPMSEQVVLVEFCSQALQVYTDHHLALDIMTVGEGLLILPIKAECVVPAITPHTNLLDFEQCFLR